MLTIPDTFRSDIEWIPELEHYAGSVRHRGGILRVGGPNYTLDDPVWFAVGTIVDIGGLLLVKGFAFRADKHVPPGVLGFTPQLWDCLGRCFVRHGGKSYWFDRKRPHNNYHKHAKSLDAYTAD